MADNIRWGILSTGTIATKFATGLQSVEDAEMLAVGSRSQAAADEFGDAFDIERRYSSYEALAQDPDIDAIYIGTPHSFHKENTLLCLNHGKAVLCEKPFAINAKEAEEMIQAAREKGVFLMEAMWSRYLPVMQRVRQILADRVIGDVIQLTADFGFHNSFNPAHRLYSPELGGGALLDIGVYPVSMASMMFGTPSQIYTMAHLGESGVDENAAIIFGYDNNLAISVITTTMRVQSHRSAIINGTKGRIRLPEPWWKTETFTLEIHGGETTEIAVPIIGNGYNYQAVEVGRCLREGLLESDIMPLEETLSVMQTLDNIRAQWGLKYPMEDV
ncbi:MAG: Gfo/Idh/MocA family oxidoreductase [Chloroflexota bacterium]